MSCRYKMGRQIWLVAVVTLVVVWPCPGVRGDGQCGAILKNVSFPGRDLRPLTKRHADSPEDCCHKCALAPGCKSWSWVSPSAGGPDTNVCWFKTSNETSMPEPGRFSGVCSVPVPSPTPKPSPFPDCDQSSKWCPPPPPLPPSPPPARVCSTCKKPKWSWDKLPVFFHGCDQDGPHGGLTADTLATIKHFSIVTLEKWQGDGVVPYMWEEDAWVIAAKQIKAESPETAVIVWLDSFRLYTANKTLNPDLQKPCTTGHFRGAIDVEEHPSWLLKNSSGSPALEPWSKCHIYDFTQANVRQYWTDMCLNLTASGVIDGCGADASWQREPTGGTTTTDVALAWDIGHRQMMRDTTRALGDGILLGKDPWEVDYHVNGALHEKCDPSNTTINTLRNLTIAARSVPRAGSAFTGPLIFECHANCRSVAECRDSVAAFLIGAGPYHYWGTGGWPTAAGHYVAELMSPKLGSPDGDGVYDDVTKTWSRTFAGGASQGGTTVKFDVVSSTGSISWPQLDPGTLR